MTKTALFLFALFVVGLRQAPAAVMLIDETHGDYRINKVTDVLINGSIYDATFNHLGYDRLQLRFPPESLITFDTPETANDAVDALITQINSAGIVPVSLNQWTLLFFIPVFEISILTSADIAIAIGVSNHNDPISPYTNRAIETGQLISFMPQGIDSDTQAFVTFSPTPISVPEGSAAREQFFLVLVMLSWCLTRRARLWWTSE